MKTRDRIYIAGHGGLTGSAIVRRLRAEGYEDLLLRRSFELDLRKQAAVEDFFDRERPRYVFFAAGRVGGIGANMRWPAEFVRDNLLMEANIVHAAWRSGVEKLIMVSSSCAYPRECPQPMREEMLFTGALEPTNRAYAIAKLAGIELGRSYGEQYGFPVVSLVACNIYGPGDNFDPASSHVLAALLRRFHEAKVSEAERVMVWGTGAPRREFMYSDDLANACLFAAERCGLGVWNVGTGTDQTIIELAEVVKEVVGFEGEIAFDASKPDGMARKLLDVSRMAALGWRAEVSLREGIERAYTRFREALSF